MFLKDTFKKFFIKDDSYDFIWFILGLVFLFTFTFLMMPRWIFCLGIGVLTSAIFRYITTDALFYNEFQNLDNRIKRFDYIFSKNIFTLLFISGFVLVLYFILSIGEEIAFISAYNFEFKMIFNIIIYILASENIVLMFNHKKVPSYKSGSKRYYSEDIDVGIKNYKAIIPSLLINIILVILIFFYKVNLNIHIGAFYLIVSMAVFSLNNRLSFW